MSLKSLDSVVALRKTLPVAITLFITSTALPAEAKLETSRTFPLEISGYQQEIIDFTQLSKDRLALNKQATPSAFEPERFVDEYFGNSIDRFQEATGYPADVSYIYSMADLNNDQVDEAIIAVFGPWCGAWECSAFIAQWNGHQYRKITGFAIASNGGEVVMLPSQTNGMVDLAVSLYDSSTRATVWRRWRFDGSDYQNTMQNVDPDMGDVILRDQRYE